MNNKRISDGANRRGRLELAAGSRRGAVLVFTLIMIFITAVALFLFIEKAIYEIRTEGVYNERERLRPHAYSALETVMAVLLDVREIDGTLYDPSQGWADPFQYAGIRFPDDLRVEVSFHDETGKLPLSQMDREQLILLFEELDYEQTLIEDLADALLAWVDESHDQGRVAGGFSGYDRGDLPYRASHQPLRSLYELRAVDGFRDFFFDSRGVPTDAFYRFAGLVSLRDFQQVNVNSAPISVLRVWGRYTEADQLRSAGEYREESFRRDRDYFENLGEANAELGTDLPGGSFATAIRYLRVEVRVGEGGPHHRLSAVLDLDTSSSADGIPDPGANNRMGSPAPNAANGQSATRDHTLESFPFTILELRENASIVH